LSFFKKNDKKKVSCSFSHERKVGRRFSKVFQLFIRTAIAPAIEKNGFFVAVVQGTLLSVGVCY